MEVYVLSNYWNTPDSEGYEVLAAYSDFEKASGAMRDEADKIKREFDPDFWDEDMTWEDEDEIHLGHDPMTLELTTIYCWRVDKLEVH